MEFRKFRANCSAILRTALCVPAPENEARF